jgi:hypothetical protein
VVGCLYSKRQRSSPATKSCRLGQGLRLVVYNSDWTDVLCLFAHRAPDVRDDSTSGPTRSSRRSISGASKVLPTRLFIVACGEPCLQDLPRCLLRFVGMHFQGGRAALLVAECTSICDALLSPAKNEIYLEGYQMALSCVFAC